MQEPQINLSDSDSNMNDYQLELFLNVRRSRSNDSLLGELINGPYYERRNLVLDFELNQQQQHEQPQSEKVKIFKTKIKKPKKKNQCDYKKNICGYITKKIIREYLGSTYRRFTESLCQKYGCSYQSSKSYYLDKIQKITGPSHISGLVNPINQSQVGIKQAFRQFFIWFLKQRYLRYLILEGKMDQKKVYVEYKNSILMNLVKEQETDASSFQGESSFPSF